MMRIKIRIFDDEQRLRQNLLEIVKGVGLSDDKYEVATIEKDDFDDSLENMSARQSSFRRDGSWIRDTSNLLDEVDILFIDFDLFESKAFLDAERIAYMARCFTDCGIIVVLNRHGHNPFDLTMKDQPESFADLDIGQDQLGNPFLWGDAHDGFAPWRWPILPKLVYDFRRRIVDAEEAIDNNLSIWSTLGVSEDIRQRIPSDLISFLGTDDEGIRFDQFIMGSRYGLQRKDTSHVYSIHSSRVADISTISRIAAARIGKWLENSILPEMDILVDAPHLVSRLPGLVIDNEIESWNGIALRNTNNLPTMRMDLIEEFRFANDHWLSRPVWYWRTLLENAELEDVREPWNIERPVWVFCEDVSSFVPEDQCHEFWAETTSPFANRFIKKCDGVDYIPPHRLAM